LAELSHRNPANTVLDSFAFSYDTASRITRISDIDGATDYAYDMRDQLSVANHADIANPDETYAYDGNGNRSSSQLHGSGYVVGDGVSGTSDNNRLTSDGTYRYAYDAEGNLIARTQIAGGAVRDFSWDHRNRLIRVTDRPSAVGAPTLVVDYTYDTLNRRIASKVDTTPVDGVDGKVMYFVYDGSDVLVELTDLDGAGPAVAAESMRYLHGPAVDQIFAQESAAGEVLWDLTDHLGTVRDLVSNSGVVVNHLKYDSYGNIISESNSVVHTRYQYTGRDHDSETGLQYSRARYYDAMTGRFLSEDPIGFSGGGPNVYSYVVNRPNEYRDPSGHNPVVAAVGAGIGYDAGFLANVAGQLAGGTNLADVDTEQAFIAGGVGAVAGALATNKGFSTVGAYGLGAAANLTQYVLTTKHCDQNLENALFSLVTGFVGGIVGGTVSRAVPLPIRSRFLSPGENPTGGKVPVSIDTMRQMRTNRTLNDQTMGATFTNVGRAAGGAGFGAIPSPLEPGGGGHCDCQ
jgi:RHS repeat-associated protein